MEQYHHQLLREKAGIWRRFLDILLCRCRKVDDATSGSYKRFYSSDEPLIKEEPEVVEDEKERRHREHI